jgi:hypothetical protein
MAFNDTERFLCRLPLMATALVIRVFTAGQPFSFD